MALLENEAFFFTTFGGGALSLAASIACIEFIRDQHVPQHLAEVGGRLADGLDALITELGMDTALALKGYPKPGPCLPPRLYSKAAVFAHHKTFNPAP